MASKQAWRGRTRSVRKDCLLTLVTFCFLGTSAEAQIRTDGTLGGVATTLSGPNFRVTEALGRLAGSNLFYSFSVFNVGNAESATFVTTTAGLANVISRVTGGSPSQINGPISLQSTNAAPNFFFINPAGVVFGQGAQIDVPAGFYVSTANYLKFPDGNFYVDPKAVSILSSAAPEAFGFLGSTRGSITIENGAILQTTSPKTDQPISLVAGDIEINGATVHTAGSDIRMFAVGSSAQDVSLTGALPDALGNLSILNGGLVSSSPAGDSHGGNIWVSAGNATIDGGGSTNVTRIYTDTHTGTDNAGDISVNVNGTLSLLNGGAIETETFSARNAGTITVKAGSLLIDDGNATVYRSGIANHAVSDTGNAGNIDVTVNGPLSIVNGGEIEAGTFSSGNAGTITVKAGTLVIDAASSPGFFTGVTNNAFDASSGSAGDINVTVGGILSILNGGAIETNSFSSGHAGHAGTITVKAGTLLIDGGSSVGFTGIAINSYSRIGTVGDLNVIVDGTLSILNSGQIAAQRLGAGLVGALTVEAGTLIIDGGSSANLFTGFTGISSRALLTIGAGSAADINVSVNGTLTLVNGGQISATTGGSGNAGTVTVKAGTLVIDGGGGGNFTGIASDAVLGTGNAGEVNVTVDGTLSIANAGQISSSTHTIGNAGAVTVSAGTIFGNSSGSIGATATALSSGQTGTVTVQTTEGITLSNGASFSIQNDATVAGPGVIPTLLTVSAPTISLLNGGQITAASSGNVAASDVQVKFGPQLTVSNASIATSAANGNGGGIAVIGTGTLVLQNGQITTSVTGQQGNGGDISIQAPTLVLQTGFIQANTVATNASGGKVTIDVNALLPSGSTLFVGGATPFIFTPDVFGFNVIQAAAPTGVSGAIQISTPVLDLIGSISALPSGFLDSGGLGRSPCAIAGGSSLSQVGRGGPPRRSGDLLWIDPIIDGSPTSPGGASSLDVLVPPYRTAGSTVRSRTNPCWS
jgi:filamentous hemagglutinin family protein